MGFGQFISSSYRNYAVDFDADGIRDIWTNEVDAIGSVANYFARHGWQGDGVVTQKVRVDEEELQNSWRLQIALLSPTKRFSSGRPWGLKFQ